VAARLIGLKHPWVLSSGSSVTAVLHLIVASLAQKQGFRADHHILGG
jgi:hypothetical protein